jgi:UDP-glucose 4-epimerase
MRILVTGGAGYIGGHTVLELLRAGHDVDVVDNLVNAKPAAVARIEELAGKEAQLHPVDLLDEAALAAVFSAAPVDAVIHFAGLKAVGESVANPLRYYQNNVAGTTNLLQVMDANDVRSIVFSSSATVYGTAEKVPFAEDEPIGAINPYGQTKVQIEQILTDVAAADDRWHAALLRYFNPVGADPSGRIGEDPQGTPNNLVPYIAQVAVGRRDTLVIHGDDYPTPDGTCIRDYIHVVDLAQGHLAALEHLDKFPGATAWNLGTGHGSSVKEVLASFERAVGRPIPHRIGPRRAGDAPVSYADVRKAERDLGWHAARSLDEMCADHWRWQRENPQGYPDNPSDS